jgi:hypothetical protein
MKRHSPEEAAMPALRYHTRGCKQLFVPIPFAFVTRSMCGDIIAERKLVLGLVPKQLQQQQKKLLDKYDPAVSAGAFYSLLRLFNVEQKS